MDPILPAFWNWFLQYSAIFVTAGLTFASSFALYLIGTRRPRLLWYATDPALVPMPQPANTASSPPPTTHVGTATLFIFNDGRAPAREVHVGHFGTPPAHGVWPDIPRETVNLTGGGTAIRFPVIPPKVLVGISYLMFIPMTANSIDQLVSYVGSEDGWARRIPVVPQRLYPPWVIFLLRLLWLAGLWVVVNALVTLIIFLWHLYR
jgi:hypothetical protein